MRKLTTQISRHRPKPRAGRPVALAVPVWIQHRATVALGLIFAGFLSLLVLLPLRTAVKIGADEDFELSKATLLLHGYPLYTEIWNDQPPLDTCIIAQILEHVSPSILGPRALTVVSSGLLLACFFVLIRRTNDLCAAVLGTILLVASPGFIELSSSCMQEIPALAPAVAALCLLRCGRPSSLFWVEILAGLVFGLALQMKLIGVIYLPLALLSLWLWHRGKPAAMSRTIASAGVFGAVVILAFVGLNLLTGNPLLIQLQQSWAAHFSSAKWFEYGTPAERTFDWSVLLKHWDTTIPALAGILVLATRARQRPDVMLPVAWLGLTLIVFPAHQPWWSYYYVHNALPLCWCAGVGFAAAFEGRGARGAWRWAVPAGLFALCAAAWMGGRVYLQEAGIRRSPRLDSCLVLKEIERFKPFAGFIYADQPIYSFHSGIPMPPHLAVISLKRFWTGEMSNARLLAELEAAKPGLILRDNDGREVPYQDLLEREYRLVYQDDAFRLFAHRTISRKPWR